ncbi:MAG: hypothetical protein MHMPM18_000871 [Marteilia pararefringens]
MSSDVSNHRTRFLQKCSQLFSSTILKPDEIPNRSRPLKAIDSKLKICKGCKEKALYDFSEKIRFRISKIIKKTKKSVYDLNRQRVLEEKVKKFSRLERCLKCSKISNTLSHSNRESEKSCVKSSSAIATPKNAKRNNLNIKRQIESIQKKKTNSLLDSFLF